MQGDRDADGCCGEAQMNVVTKWLISVVVLGLVTLEVMPVPELNRIGEALALIGGALVAVWTLLANRRDQRVERVLRLHEEFTTGEIGNARWRLRNHLARALPAGAKPHQVGQVRTAQLESGKLGQYESVVVSASPRYDATLILRFFERVRVAQNQGAVDPLMVCSLLGRHAGWWEIAILRSESYVQEREPLTLLTDWANQYARKYAQRPGLEKWWCARERNFEGTVELEDQRRRAQARS